jgi:polar amino acid transport system substrate-binding protein
MSFFAGLSLSFLPRRRATRTIALAFGLALLAGTPATAAPALSLGIPGNAPLAGLDGEHVTGIVALATVAALEEMGRQVTAKRLPFKRMYHDVHSGRLDVAVSVLRTEERARQAYYSAPIVTEYTVIMVPRGRGFPFRRLADLDGKRIGAQLGFVYPGLQQTRAQLIREKNYEVNIRKVAAGKLDGAVVGSITGPYLARELGLSDRIEFLPLAIGEVPLGAALSKSAFDESDLAAFDAAVSKFRGGAEWRKALAAKDIAQLIKAWPVAGG